MGKYIQQIYTHTKDATTNNYALQNFKFSKLFLFFRKDLKIQKKIFTKVYFYE